MSGLEIPGLVFGVLPVFVQVLQSYRNIHDTLHTFRHYSREVKRIKNRFRVQQQNFQNEYSLLQYVIAGEDGEDDLQATWTSDHTARRKALLEEHLNKRIDDSYETFTDIVNDTKKELDEMEESLKAFSVLKIVFNKKRYETHLTKLRESNMDLHTFRMQLDELLKKRSNTFSQPQVRKFLPRHYSSVQKVSQTLHEALSSAWDCSYSGHETHYGKLCVEAQVQDMVRLDMALSYKMGQDDNRSNLLRKDDDHIWIYVQSAKIEPKFTDLMRQNSVDDALPSSDTPSVTLCPSQSNANISFALQPVAQPQSSKRRKLQFAGDCTLSQSSPYVSAEAFNLRHSTKIRNLCQHIEKTAHSSKACGSGECIGYLETPRLFKHIFYSSEQRTFGNSTGTERRLTQKVVNLEYLLRVTNREPALVDTGSKFKIAHKMATAVLQYHSTPWLREDWRLKDLAYFGNLQELSDESLRTLHLTFRFNQSDQDPESTCTRWGSIMSSDSTYSSLESIYYRYGINNAVLFSLGVALLELAYHQPLELMCGTQDYIAVARKKARSGYPLGRKYQKIVQQCLQCDFGMGSDLTKTELQTAIYGNVICSLEEMMSSLSLD
ncbi:uncharacterized protein N7479_004753 [Penicillium vulpinum]|uniref:uncharacterized protein n=1 Tax=Penicillium vulpinum TaxID=29845 RepID=UPI002548044A|nr:uncharacterized protein N7479_004753 [Penicillium vulpinum]KAJ5964877.1 hypothetical protein N7479_004753 [Penicillium vulpinum]